jgi:hypothetical protein
MKQMMLLLIKFTPIFSLGLLLAGVIYNLGYFTQVGIRFFGLFTVSEHIVFSLQAIPPITVIVVLSLVLMIFLFIGAWSLGIPAFQFESTEQFTRFVREKPIPLRRWLLDNAKLLVPAVAFIAVVAVLVKGIVAAGILLLLLASLAMSEVCERRFQRIMASSLLIILFCSLILYLVFVMGANDANHRLQCSHDRDVVTLVNGEKIDGRLLRAGEIGVLIAIFHGTTIELLKNDEVARVTFYRGGASPPPPCRQHFIMY